LADNETCDQVTGERIKASPKEVRQWKPVHPTGRLWKFKLSQADAWIEAGGAAESDNEKVGP
jgi:hypothetical protein